MGKYEKKTEGRLRYISSSHSVLSVSTPFGRVKCCRIDFGGDGSIYVPFPYFKSNKGVVSRVLFPNNIDNTITYELLLNEVPVLYNVKFTHHVSGIVHFKKDDNSKDVLLPERQSFPLRQQIGHVFKLYIYGLSGFDWVGKLKQHDMYFNFNYCNRHPGGILIRAEWRRKADILENSDPMKVIGPTSTAIDKKSGKEQKVFFLGQPLPSPCQDKLLMITSEEIDVAKGVDKPTMVFLGGFDPHEKKLNEPDPYISGALAFYYQ